MSRWRVYILILFLFSFMAFSDYNSQARDKPLSNACASETGSNVLSKENKICLQCHSKRGVYKTFQNGESISVYVDSEAFKTTVHNFLECPDCHRDFSIDEHPKRRFRSKAQYKIKSSRICRRCHKDDQIKSKPIHASLFIEEKKGKSSVCTDCHGSHSVMPITGGKLFTTEKRYCMSCHAYDFHTEFRNGQVLSLKTDAKVLDDSVHTMLSCSDCHFGFSSEEHPQRNFRTERDYVIASSESCRRCHFDKYTKTLEGIHYEILSQGNLKAPVCTDCHGSHAIARISKKRVLIAQRCQDCHEEIYQIYVESIHGDALINESNWDVPICIDCHKAHNIRNPLTLEWHEKIPELCSNCHADKQVMDRYGLSTDVVQSYLSDFHGVTLSFYRKQREELHKPARPIAVCTDCHGTHNIMSISGMDIAIVKKNLTERCQKCHENVSENFPDAWLSHYEPSLKKAPLVFIVNLFYKIFIPFMVLGLILQILLHVWRYSFNR